MTTLTVTAKGTHLSDAVRRAIEVTPDGKEFRTARSFSLPREFALIHRVLSSSVGMLCQLEARAPYRAVVEKWMPEIFEA